MDELISISKVFFVININICIILGLLLFFHPDIYIHTAWLFLKNSQWVIIPLSIWAGYNDSNLTKLCNIVGSFLLCNFELCVVLILILILTKMSLYTAWIILKYSQLALIPFSIWFGLRDAKSYTPRIQHTFRTTYNEENDKEKFCKDCKYCRWQDRLHDHRDKLIEWEGWYCEHRKEWWRGADPLFGGWKGPKDTVCSKFWAR